MKKLFTLLLSILLVLSMLSACGGNRGNVDGGEGNTAKDVEIAVWSAGGGTQWLTDLVNAFNAKQSEYHVYFTESANSDTVTVAYGMPDIDTVDLYLTYVKSMDTSYMEPLDDIILAATADGDQKEIGEKFSTGYLALEEAPDGKHYTLTYNGGVVSLFYNKELFEQAGITQLPRTTDELSVVCDTLYSKGITPLCHFGGVGYYEYLNDVFIAQYGGTEAFQKFYMCEDENGVSPSKEVFTNKDGRYYALKAYEKFITPEYTLTGSNTKSHTEIQTEFINDRAAMMVNGSWLQNEMKSTGTVDKLGEMKTPVLSAIIDNLTTVKSDMALRKVITAVDQVTDGEKQLSDFQNGDSYLVDGMEVSTQDWDAIYAARNTLAVNFSGHDAFIPTYSKSKEGAVEFLKFMYSDEGYSIYVNATKCPWPMSLSTGEQVDISSFNSFEQRQFELLGSAQYLVDSNTAAKHRIFVDGGATPYAGVTFIEKFCSQNAADRKTADEIWDQVVAAINDNYEANWLKNIK